MFISTTLPKRSVGTIEVNACQPEFGRKKNKVCKTDTMLCIRKWIKKEKRKEDFTQPLPFPEPRTRFYDSSKASDWSFSFWTATWRLYRCFLSNANHSILLTFAQPESVFYLLGLIFGIVFLRMNALKIPIVAIIETIREKSRAKKSNIIRFLFFFPRRTNVIHRCIFDPVLIDKNFS